MESATPFRIVLFRRSRSVPEDVYYIIYNICIQAAYNVIPALKHRIVVRRRNNLDATSFSGPGPVETARFNCFSIVLTGH